MGLQVVCLSPGKLQDNMLQATESTCGLPPLGDVVYDCTVTNSSTYNIASSQLSFRQCTPDVIAEVAGNALTEDFLQQLRVESMLGGYFQSGVHVMDSTLTAFRALYLCQPDVTVSRVAHFKALSWLQ